MNKDVKAQIQLTPLYDIHNSFNASMINFAGWKLPLYYTGIIQEHNHVRSQVGLFDVSHMGRIEVDPISTEKLENIIPIDIKNMKLGRVKYSILINKSGNIIDDLLVYKLKDTILLVVNASRIKAVNNLLSDVPGLLYKELRDTAQISIQGPKSEMVIKRIFSNSNSLKFMEIGEYIYESFQYLISRTGYTGEDGFEIISIRDGILKIVSILLEYKELKLIGLGARDSLRLEAGLCLYGNEINEEINPIESGLSWVFDKKRIQLENFYGARSIKNKTLNRPFLKRYGFKINEKCIARHGMEVKNNLGIKRGYITSGCFSPTMDKSICMGLIDSKWDEKEELFVSIRKKIVKITKVDLPFVEHKYHNKKRKNNE